MNEPQTLDEVMAVAVGGVVAAIIEDDDAQAKEIFDEAMGWVEEHYTLRRDPSLPRGHGRHCR